MPMPPMTGSSWRFGEIVLVSFPFTDQQGHKQRPAVVVSSAAYQQRRPDIVLMPITSQVAARLHFGEVPVQDWHAAGLIAPSRVKPILFTVEAHLIRKPIGTLTAADQAQLKTELAKIIG